MWKLSPVVRIRRLSDSEITSGRITSGQKKRDEKMEDNKDEVAVAIAREVAAAVTTALREHHQELRQHGVKLSVRPDPFHGYSGEDASRWMSKYERFGSLQQWTEEQSVSALALFLKGPAELWYLENQLRFGRDFRHMQGVFIDKFGVDGHRGLAEEQLLARKQSREESIDSYAYDVRARCHQLGKTPRDAVSSFLRGLLPQIKGQVAVMQPTTIEEAERIARTALTYANITPPVATVAEITPEASALEQMTGMLTTLVEALSFQPRDQPRDPPRDEPREQQQHQDREQGTVPPKTGIWRTWTGDDITGGKFKHL